MTKNPRLFQGRDLDAESGLYYFRNRQYDPQHGRFLSRDPAGYADSYCLYQFVNNNPVCYIDPEGLAAGAGWGTIIEHLVDKLQLQGGSIEMNADRGANMQECDTCPKSADSVTAAHYNWSMINLLGMKVFNVGIILEWKFTGASIYEAHFEFEEGSYVYMGFSIKITAQLFDGGIRLNENNSCVCGCKGVAALDAAITLILTKHFIIGSSSEILPKVNVTIYGDGGAE